MPAKCDICGKTSVKGNTIKRRGKAKYLGGVGRKITGVTRRRFGVNLQRIRATLPNGTSARIRVCAQCLRSGRVQKRIKRLMPQPAAPAQ